MSTYHSDIEGPSILSMKSMSHLQFQDALNDANINRQQKSIDSGNIHGGTSSGDAADGDICDDVKLYNISKDDDNQNDESGARVGDDDQDLYF
jgi:hypothetical protein